MIVTAYLATYTLQPLAIPHINAQPVVRTVCAVSMGKAMVSKEGRSVTR